MRKKILLTNDDGIGAAGLKHLWRGLSSFADLFVVAPATEQSGVGLSLTTRHPIHVKQMKWLPGSLAWSVTGTPADCVKIAVSSLLENPPDLIVSGINRGSNAGRNLLYSGTVGGVIEGVIRGIPGIAVSSVNWHAPNFKLAETNILKIVQYALEFPLPAGSLLNVNFPSQGPLKGFRLARQGKGYLKENLQKRDHPVGGHYYWLGHQYSLHEEFHDSDILLLQEGYVTAVPVHVDELTNHHHLEQHRHNFNNYFNKSSQY